MKAASIFLSAYLLISAFMPRMDLHHLQLLPNLVDHYFEHQERYQAEGQDLSFMEFFIDHFIDFSSHQGGHQKLPFFQGSTATLVFNLDLIGLPLLQKPVTFQYELVFDYQDFFSEGKTGTIFRPPILTA